MSTKQMKSGAAKRDGRESDDERREAIWREAYGARTKEDLLRLYSKWAEDYDADHESIGFRGHELAAEVLARHVTRRDLVRVLDAGAGTGAAGVALRQLGFRDVVGVDLSPEMIARAEAKGVYRRTLVADLSLPVDGLRENAYDAAILVGVFSFGQAPPEALDEVLRVVRPGGVVVLTMRTDFHEQDAMGIRSKCEALEEQGLWATLEITEPRPYLPKKDPDALFRVWAFRVTKSEVPEVEDGFEDAVREAFESGAFVKEIDHAWIWDSTASRLYNRYTRTDGYYLTDCEEEIVREHVAEICKGEPTIVELGCGSARKICHVLEHRLGPDGGGGDVHYVPVDVSVGALRATRRELERRFGDDLRIDPRHGMFEDVLPSLPDEQGKLVFFFGSSLGNLASLSDTVDFLRMLRERMSPKDRFVVGLDLHKDEDVLERAYNEEDSCRAFFVHMLRRINEYLGADFDTRVFELSSTYEEEPPFHGVRTRRVNLRVAPTEPQSTWVRKLDLEVHLDPGQPIQVGISRKFEPDSIAALARLAGFRLTNQWFDRRRWFSLNELVPAAGDAEGAPAER